MSSISSTTKTPYIIEEAPELSLAALNLDESSSEAADSTSETSKELASTSVKLHPEESPVRKLTTTEVFREMRSKICRIETTPGKSTGFFLNNEGYVVTCMHSLMAHVPITQIHETFMKVYDSSDHRYIPSFFNTTTGQLTEHISYEESKREQQLDACVMKIDERVDHFDPIPNEIKLEPGMTVYFAGYPLSQTDITFHKGTISSVYERDDIEEFTIDGTVVPGNSGGPVVVQHKGKLYLAGVITSSVTDLDPDFALHEQSLAQLRAQGELDSFRLDIPYPDGKTRSVSALDLTSLGLSVIARNMSTGVGKALHIDHIYELFLNTLKFRPSLESASSSSSFPVIKKSEIIKVMKENGWYLLREGKKHEIWTNGVKQQTLGRHKKKEIPNPTAQSIIDDVEAHPAVKAEPQEANASSSSGSGKKKAKKGHR